jgi:hypothetical protein
MLEARCIVLGGVLALVHRLDFSAESLGYQQVGHCVDSGTAMPGAVGCSLTVPLVVSLDGQACWGELSALLGWTRTGEASDVFAPNWECRKLVLCRVAGWHCYRLLKILSLVDAMVVGTGRFLRLSWLPEGLWRCRSRLVPPPLFPEGVLCLPGSARLWFTHLSWPTGLAGSAPAAALILPVVAKSCDEM